jgi:hypothetical protein
MVPMAIKSIVALADGDDLHSVLSAAVALTARLSGRLDVLHIKTDPYDMIPIGVEGLTGGVIEEITDRSRRSKRRIQLLYMIASSGNRFTKEVVRRCADAVVASRFADPGAGQPDESPPTRCLKAVLGDVETGRPHAHSSGLLCHGNWTDWLERQHGPLRR